MELLSSPRAETGGRTIGLHIYQAGGKCRHRFASMEGHGAKRARPREELRELVERIDRNNPGWTSREIERELESLSPVKYGNWKEDTPSAGSRLRQIQRWRSGHGSPPRPTPGRLPFQHLWPVGESQRHELETAFPARPIAQRATHRIFLYNCSAEVVREVRARVGGQEVLYEPSIGPGKFAELPWARNEGILERALKAPDGAVLSERLDVEFALEKGLKWARLVGELTLHESDGWIRFRSDDGAAKEVA